MHFDDRLATVLRHRAAGERAARTQFRQLLDLLGRRRHGRDESLLAAAWLRLGALGEAIPANDRAEIIREPSWRFANPELAAHFAEDEPVVAAAALGTAQLSEEDWEALIPRLPVRARGFLRLRRDLPPGAERVLDRLGVRDRALPLPPGEESLVVRTSDPGPYEDSSPVESAPQSGDDRVVTPFPANDADEVPAQPSTLDNARTAEGTPIAALVERIEAFKRSRAEADALARPESTDPRLPFVEPDLAHPRREDDGFVFTTDPESRIVWAEDRMAAMVRYLKLSDVLEGAPRIGLMRRQPLSGVAVELEGGPALEGTWYLDAAPRFDNEGGRFTGYAGRLRRAGEYSEEDTQDPESDRIRQLLHELRTPVNAIQGFAEVIQQQLFGPVPHEYRALAASIAGDSARMLAGFDELDRLAKLESGANELEIGSADFSALVAGQLEQLAPILKPRNAGFASKIEPGCLIGLAENEAEALSWRILAALAAAMAPSETATIVMRCADQEMTLHCQLPAALAKRDYVFAAEATKTGQGGSLSAGSFGSGFALRLARAEARSIGGDLTRVEDSIVLALPLLTAAEAEPSAGDDVLGAVEPGPS